MIFPSLSRIFSFLKLAATSPKNNALSVVGNTTPISSVSLAQEIYRAGFAHEWRSFSAGIDSTEYRESAKNYWASRAGNDQAKHNQDELNRVLWGEQHVRVLSRREWLALENTPEKQAARASQAEAWYLEQRDRATAKLTDR